jgi:endonuclease YncB( thermonuclease family)
MLLSLTGARPLPVPSGWMPEAESGHVVRGVARITDGDTLRIGSTRIRLFGVDAPEAGQRCSDRAGNDWACGAAATAKLEALVARRVVRCDLQEADRYGRMVASCSVDGRDLGAAIVGEGLARAYARYSDRYLGEEAAARAAGRGLWQAEAEAPWDWRRDRRLRREAAPADRQVVAAPADPDCAIKGNISGDGRRLYHTPAMPSWPRTRIDQGRGERFFCDEAAARAAGWLPASGGGR